MHGTRYGDFSRFGFDPAKGYTGVLAQQGRVQLDADFNEQRAIVEHALRVALNDLLPGSWAPASKPGFGVHARVARRFEGADRLLLDESGSLGPGGGGQHTLELWLTWSGGAAVLVDCRGRDGDLGYEVAIEETGTVVLVLSVRQGPGGTLRLYSATPVHVGEPLHLAVVVGDAFAALVIDGRQVAHTRHSGLAERDTSVLVFGGPAADTSRNVGLRGHVTAIRVWAVARTIADLAAATHAAPTTEWATTDPGLLALWSFDQPGDQALNDAAGGRTATINDGGSTNWHLVDLVIEPGRLYVDGVPCELTEPITYTSQPGTSGALPKSGTHLAYLEAWEESFGAAEDASLREVALGGLDPSVRTRMATRVRLQQVDEDDTNGLMPSDKIKLGRLAAMHTGHRAPGNHLYRVEIHGAGELTGDRQATFKWSRDNGASVFAVAAGHQHDVLQVLYAAAGATPLVPDDVVEALPDGAPLDSPTHPLLRVTAVSTAHGTITLDRSVPAGTKLLRRWDNRQRVDPAPGTGAELPVAGDWIELEDGIRIRFEAGEFRRGDYWWIVSRMDSGTIEWPQASGHPKVLEPCGVERLRAPLARLSLKNGWIEIEDLRRILAPTPSPGSAPAVWGSAAAPSAPPDVGSGDQPEEEDVEMVVRESSNGESDEEPDLEINLDVLDEIEDDDDAAAVGGAASVPSVADFPGSLSVAGADWEASEAADSEAAASGPQPSWPSNSPGPASEPAEPEWSEPPWQPPISAPVSPEPTHETAAGPGWSHIGGLELGGGVLRSAASVADAIVLLTDKGLFALSVVEGEATKLASLPDRHHGSELSAIGRLLLLQGGGAEEHADGRLFGFDLDIGEWARRAPIPVRHAHAAVAVAHGHLHVLGGRSRGLRPRVHGTHHVYEAAADRWHEALELPTPRAKAAAATLANRVHVVGGHGAGRRGETHQAHVAHESFDLDRGSWRAEPALPEARPVIASTAHNGRHVVIVGGERAGHGGHAAADVHEYDPATRTWKRRPGVPASLRDPIVVVSHNRRLLAFGTRADGGVEIHELT